MEKKNTRTVNKVFADVHCISFLYKIYLFIDNKTSSNIS